MLKFVPSISDIKGFYDNFLYYSANIAYRFFPPQSEKILIIGKNVQRLIFEGGQQFEDWEWEHINNFIYYVRDNQIEVSDQIRNIVYHPE